ncbi:MAG: glycoside hydrolase family 99-like domain-containing protein [Candidatus Brocadiaceae bacterium]|nr:glycoside hydrolase family 99-like domain-containing protein [Candidatus Brocadiaceae bacterium]
MVGSFVKIGAYVYPGWHACPERDLHFPPGWSEWDLVLNASPRFQGHNQPRLPQDGPYDDSLPVTAQKQVRLATEFGVDLFVYGFFWSRGKRVFGKALEKGFLGKGGGGDFPFALMWANRMPRGVLPVRYEQGTEIDPGRLVYTDPEDFMDLIRYLEERYFFRRNYFRIHDKPLFSIFDSSFFLRQMGIKKASHVIHQARSYLREKGYPGLHLMAINPAPALIAEFIYAGFDSVSHYVWLPDWKGSFLQDYSVITGRRSREWEGFAGKSELPYFPSVSPGWDATPRGETYGNCKPQRYPWSPVVIHEHPKLFSDFLGKAIRYTKKRNNPPLCFIASWNEWSEGHYLEPDRRFGTAWLEAVRKEKGNAL